MMKIVHKRPPNWDRIIKVFPQVEGMRGIVFAYGDHLCNPDAVTIQPEIMAHEIVHGCRQKDDPAGWWERYLEDPQFRLKEELQAHKAELAAVNLNVKDRNRRARNLAVTAKRLSAPLYGGIIRYSDALCLLRA